MSLHYTQDEFEKIERECDSLRTQLGLERAISDELAAELEPISCHKENCKDEGHLRQKDALVKYHVQRSSVESAKMPDAEANDQNSAPGSRRERIDT